MSGKEKSHKHIYIYNFGDCPRTGFVYLFWGSLPMGRNTHKQDPKKIPGQSRETFVYVFFVVCWFFFQEISKQIVGDLLTGIDGSFHSAIC